MTIVFVVILTLIIIGIVGNFAKNVFGCCCHECGSKMTPFHKLPETSQGDILAYFRNFENREPDTKGIFACPKCHLVYDDFSGERKSMEGDEKTICKTCNTLGLWYMGPLVNSGELPKFQKQNPTVIKRIECLRCERKPTGLWDCVTCNTKTKIMGCRKCYSVYAWMSVYGSQFKFLVPLSDKDVLKKAIDAQWGIFEV